MGGSDPTAAPSVPGNRMLIGPSGVPFELMAGVAASLVREDPNNVRYVDGLDPEPAPTVSNNDDTQTAVMPARASE